MNQLQIAECGLQIEKPRRTMNMGESLTAKRWVPNNCECGARGGQYLAHYDLMLCSCGKMHWALQSKRNGPLVLFLWPGSYDRSKWK